MDWTSDGTAWTTTIGINFFSFILRLRSYKSTDGGATWVFDDTFSGSHTLADKQIMWVDHSATSPHQDNIYVIWHNGPVVYMNRRTGPVGSWGSPIRVSGSETTGTGIGGDVKANAEGDVFGFWPDTGSRRLIVAKSTDGGTSYGTPTIIATGYGAFDIGIPSFLNRRALIYVAGGAFRTPDRDDVYATWTDLSGTVACNNPAHEPGSNVTSPCKTRIWFSRSTDGGATWEPPRTLNDQPSLNDQFNQWLAVDETTGALGVIYYDTVGDPGRRKTDVWYQSSFDHGTTWSAPVKVTSAQTDETVAGAESFNQYGDYNGLSGYAGLFFPSWTDRRNNAREEIWTAAVFDPACTAPGAPAIGGATVPGDNQVQVTWGNGSPPADRFNVYRAFGACAAPGAFSRIAGGVLGTAHVDGGVSGGVTYAYHVRGLDATGACESAPSGCVEATATGACTLPPEFAGLATAASAGGATCSVELSWAAASPVCDGPVTYDVYRSRTAGFTPSPANRIAGGVTGTTYLDTSPLHDGLTYHYVVRAVDAGNGAEEGNSVRRSAVPTGPFASALPSVETFEGTQSGGGFDHPGWSHGPDVGPTDWGWSTTQAQSGTHSWHSASLGFESSRILTSPTFEAVPGTRLTFWHTHDFESPSTCFDGGTLEVSTDGGATWSVISPAAFLAGGFNGTISPFFGNPLAGAAAWCGNLGAMSPVVADLSTYSSPATRLRWHAGDDVSIAFPGWYVDSVSITEVCHAAPSPPMAFYTLSPCRLVDTRDPAGPRGGPALQPGQQRTFVLTGACDVPPTARALSVNVTVTGPAAAGHLRLFPDDLPAPNTSVINFSTGQTRANNAVLELATDGAGSVAVRAVTAGQVHLIVDVNGYFE